MDRVIQMGPIILDIQGKVLSSEEEEILQHPFVGGVIFFSRNYESREQLAALADHIKRIRPLLLCVDQEGGRVQRFTEECTSLPNMRILGDFLDAGFYSLSEIQQISEKLGHLMALEVRSLGVDLSFAPVLDLDMGVSEILKGRAIHSDPSVIARLATSYIKGMSLAGMQATGKHFPGHGSVKLDSHLFLPQDDRPFELLAKDMMPFIKLIEEGIGALMTAHIVYPKVDPYPVSFSTYWLQIVLRNKLKFKGTIVSDDLSMEGASGIGDYPSRAQKALEAGCDFILVCNNRDGVSSILDKLKFNDPLLSHQRRLNLLAKAPAIPWKDLAKNPIWKDLHNEISSLEKISL